MKYKSCDFLGFADQQQFNMHRDKILECSYPSEMEIYCVAVFRLTLDNNETIVNFIEIPLYKDDKLYQAVFSAVHDNYFSNELIDGDDSYFDREKARKRIDEYMETGIGSYWKSNPNKDNYIFFDKILTVEEIKDFAEYINPLRHPEGKRICVVRFYLKSHGEEMALFHEVWCDSTQDLARMVLFLANHKLGYHDKLITGPRGVNFNQFEIADMRILVSTIEQQFRAGFYSYMR